MSYNIGQINSGFVSLTSGAVAITTNKAKFKTTATITYMIDGLFKSKGAADNLVFSSGHASLAAGQACVFGLWLDGAGNVSTTQGPIVAVGDPCPVPPTPNGAALFGLIKVSTTTGFVPNTTEFDANGVTTTYINAGVMPGSAQ